MKILAACCSTRLLEIDASRRSYCTSPSAHDRNLGNNMWEYAAAF